MYENQEKKRARAIGAAIGKAGTGTYQIAIEFEYLDEQGGITYYGPLTDRALEYTMRNVRAAGFQGDDLSELSSLSGETPEVMLVVEPEEYEGRVTWKVKFVNGMGGLAMKNALQGDELTSFARSMKGRILALNRDNGTSPSAPKKPNRRTPPAEGSGGGPDDIPF